MSGSGGGGYVPPQRTVFNCETSRITTNVSSIDIAVLAKHKAGNILDVEFGKNETLVLVDGDGEILGSILHSNTSDIIDCMKKGNEYNAEIISINSPACKVLIKRK